MDDEASDSDEGSDEEEDDYDDGFEVGLNDQGSVDEIDSLSETSSADRSGDLFDTGTCLQEPQKSGFSIGSSFNNHTSGMIDNHSAAADVKRMEGGPEEEGEEGLLRTCTPNFHNDEVRSHEDCLVHNLVADLVDHPKPSHVLN